MAVQYLVPFEPRRATGRLPFSVPVHRTLVPALYLYIVVSLGLLITPLALSGAELKQPQKSASLTDNEVVLAPDRLIEKELKAGESHTYQISLASGQFLRVVAEQLGLDLTIEMFGTDNKPIIKVNNPDLAQGPETVSLIADVSGVYRIRIRALDEGTSGGRYRVRVDELRKTIPEDANRVAAEKAFADGEALAYQWAPDSLRKAIEKYKTAVSLWRALNDRHGEGMAYNSLAAVSLYLGERQTGKDYLDKALAARTAAGDRPGVVQTMNNIGAYWTVNNLEKGLEEYKKALAINKEIADPVMEAVIQANIGHIYYRFGQLGDALECFVISRQLSQSTGNKRSESMALLMIGDTFGRLGNEQKQLEHYEGALKIFRSLRLHVEEARTLINLGGVHTLKGDNQKALDYYNQATSLFEKIEDRRVIAAAQLAVGSLYVQVGKNKEAIAILLQVREFCHREKLKGLEGDSLYSLGIAHYNTGEKNQAVDELNQALALSLEAGEAEGIVGVLSGLMNIMQSLGKPNLAIFYGKEAVNRVQTQRGNVMGLDKLLQKSFLKSKEQIYRNLADLLITQGRLPEAEEVLNLLKEEEFAGLVRRSGNKRGVIPYSKAEAKSLEIINRLAQIGKELSELLQRNDRGLLDDAGRMRIKQLGEEIKIANADFQKSLVELSNVGSQEKGLDVVKEEAQALTEDLRELGPGTVALYTVLVRNSKGEILNGWIFLATPEFPKAYPIDVTNIEKVIFNFRAVLSSPMYDPQPLAKQLYRMLFMQTSEKQKQTLAADLETYLKDRIDKTLMWSLDSILRYVPIAALHDGERYLVEKYRNVVFNTASKARLKDGVKQKWTALGLGVSEERQEGGLHFSALPGAESELEKIIKTDNSPSGILPGLVKRNAEFTRDAMIDALLAKSPSVVHISSHFSYHAANFDESFLLLGKGRWTVQEMNKETNLFRKVDLVTLSACDTAMGKADGKDAEGFAYLAQSLGAKAVIATLWKVDDIGTQVLMPEFYRLRETGLVKSEALRRVQLALLQGKLSGATSATDKIKSRNINSWEPEPELGPPFEKDPQRPYAHPHYWAPFILVGNWK